MKIKTIAMTGLGAIALAAATPAFAVTNFSTNFDSLAVAPGSYSIVSAIEGWTATAGAGIEVQNNAAGAPFSAPNLVELDSTNNTTMSRLIDPGTYTLTYRYSGRPGRPASTNGIEALLGSTSLGVSQSAGGSSTSWLLVSSNFTVLSATTLSFKAVGTSDSYGGYIDDINLVGTAAVPEPATWAMMLVGFGLVGSSLRRRNVRVSFA